MKKILFCCLIPFLLYGCASTTDRDLQPDATTNNVARANLNLGVAYMQRGEYEKSLEKLDRARKADPGYYATYNAYGLLYQLLGKNREAEENFKKALSLNRNDSATRNNYGRFLCQQGRYKEAEETFMEAANNPLYETPEIAITNAGTCAMMKGEKDLAEKYFRQALDRNPKIPVALLQMSQLSYDEGSYLSARGYLQRYLEVAKHTPASLWLGIRIEKKLGDKDAVASYKLLLRNNFPDSEETKLLNESGS